MFYNFTNAQLFIAAMYSLLLSSSLRISQTPQSQDCGFPQALRIGVLPRCPGAGLFE